MAGPVASYMLSLIRALVQHICETHGWTGHELFHLSFFLSYFKRDETSIQQSKEETPHLSVKYPR